MNLLRSALPRLLFVALCLGILGGALSETAQAQYRLVNAFPSLFNLDRPLDLQRTPAYPERIFVVQQGGVILSVDENGDGSEADTLADLTDVVMDIVPSWEEGLLGLAFHPDHAENGYVYVYYNTFPVSKGGPHRSIISRFTTTGTPPRIDRSTELVLLDIPQPLQWHNGGQLAFHPLEDEANLYISFGDGGGGGDPFEHAQDLTTLFGSILRINVDEPGDDLPYGIPDDNPFAGNEEGIREEIWAYGLRNPWRFSIDPVTGWLWVGDVGQATWEEVTVITEAGANLGWDVKEGPFCFDAPDPGEPACNDASLTDPVWWYQHTNGNGSITGGRVYRGTAIPELVGQYVYADFISGRIWALDTETPGGPFNEELVRIFQISSVGVDSQGELLLTSFNRRIYRLVRDPVSAEDGTESAGARLSLAGANPVTSTASLRVETDRAERVQVAVYDVLGRRVGDLWDGVLPEGRQPLRWNAAGVAPGVYIVRMHTGRTIESVRVTVVR